MKSHDCHVLMTQRLPVAIRGIMDEHVRYAVWPLQLFDVITRKSIGVRQLKTLQDEIVVILCELEIYFPPAFCDICVHLLLHVVDDIRQIGPTFLHNMMPFEMQNGVMKGYVRNRARPDASMAKGFLTYECISFCQNYLSTEDDEDHVGLPPRTHLGRLAGVGHREGYRSVHVGIANRRDDGDRAHRVALQHLKLIKPFVQEHKSMIEQNYIDMGRPRKMGDVTKEHNSSFTRWFKQTQLLEAQRKRPSTEDEKLIYTLSQGTGHNNPRFYQFGIRDLRYDHVFEPAHRHHRRRLRDAAGLLRRRAPAAALHGRRGAPGRCRRRRPLLSQQELSTAIRDLATVVQGIRLYLIGTQGMTTPPLPPPLAAYRPRRQP
ncbi:hypothetical protein QYE76_010971 [Lolium multiflorum]|uniref:DUF4218 domain-containing protein n=1 Tax=Lolium multiflorum TaxID=4521 RepID=A0AAD8TY54_LOLMU|nr:hypothetical protein QYE76_010971 [Lolium multiflorum]